MSRGDTVTWYSTIPKARSQCFLPLAWKDLLCLRASRTQCSKSHPLLPSSLGQGEGLAIGSLFLKLTCTKGNKSDLST